MTEEHSDAEIVQKVYAMLLNTPRLLYLKFEKGDDSRLIAAFVDEKELYVERFGSIKNCERAFAAAIVVLTTSCQPPFIEIGAQTLVQPAYIARIIKHEDKQAYFTVIQFTNEHNLAYGHFTMSERDAYYDLALQAFKMKPEYKDLTASTTKQ